MTIKTYFDAIKVISLPTRTDRRRAIARDLARQQMPLEPGKIEVFDAIRPDSDGGFPSIGAHGCFLSHLGVLKQARDSRLGRVLILEDDLQLSRRLGLFEPMVVERLEQGDWDLVYLGHNVDLSDAPPRLVPYADPLVQTHFIGYHSRVFDHLIAFLEDILRRPPGHPDGGPMHYDGALSTFRANNPDVVTLLAAPILGWQRSSRTDLHPLRWFDRLPVLNGVVGVARRGRSWIRSYR